MTTPNPRQALRDDALAAVADFERIDAATPRPPPQPAPPARPIAQWWASIAAHVLRVGSDGDRWFIGCVRRPGLIWPQGINLHYLNPSDITAMIPDHPIALYLDHAPPRIGTCVEFEVLTDHLGPGLWTAGNLWPQAPEQLPARLSCGWNPETDRPTEVTTLREVSLTDTSADTRSAIYVQPGTTASLDPRTNRLLNVLDAAAGEGDALHLLAGSEGEPLSALLNWSATHNDTEPYTLWTLTHPAARRHHTAARHDRPAQQQTR